MEALQELLADAPPGAVTHDLGLDTALATCWEMLRGNAEGGMEPYKLLGRIESIVWQPPFLTFVIERHDGTVRGSTRAELQHWEVNLDNRTASIIKEGHRQLEPMAPRLSIKKMAEEVAGLIVSGKSDSRIRRLADGTTKIVLSKVFPSPSGFKRTIKSRRKRLVEYVKGQLQEHGWMQIGGEGFRLIGAHNPPA